MGRKTVKIGDFLIRVKQPVEIQNSIEYKRITIKTKHQGIFLRDALKGSLIGTKLQFVVTKGQFILSKIDARLGAFGIVPEELDGAIITGNFWVFDVDETKINIDWFNLFTSSGNFYDICNQASSGTTHRKYLNEEKFLDFEIDLPELYEQHAFMNKYESYYTSYKSVLSEIDQQQAHLQLLRQTVLQEAMKGDLTKRNKAENIFAEQEIEDLRNSYQAIEAKKRGIKSFTYKKADKIDLGGRTKGVDELFIIPQSWRWVSLAQVTWSISDGPHFSPKYVQEGYPIVSSRNISLESGLNFSTAKFVSPIDFEEFIKRGKPEVGDILYTKGGTTGIPAIVEEEKDFCVWVHVALLKLIKEVIDPYYLRLVLTSSFVYNQSQKQTHGIGNKDLGLTRMSFIAFPLPPLTEQHRIVAKVQQLQLHISQIEAQVQQSRQYAQQLLQSVLKEAFEQKRIDARASDLEIVGIKSN